MSDIRPPLFIDPSVRRLVDQGDELCARSAAIQAQADALGDWLRRLYADSIDLIEAFRAR
jgi:hypothetical protein